MFTLLIKSLKKKPSSTLKNINYFYHINSNKILVFSIFLGLYLKGVTEHFKTKYLCILIESC